MPTLLHIDSSAGGTTSRSRTITAAFAESWLAAHDGGRVIHRDLHAEPPAHLPSAALHWAEGLVVGQRPTEWAAAQRQYIDELLGADALVVGVPLYNYSMPSTLKAWVDHVHVPGVTAGMPHRPLEGRAAVLVSARGGSYGSADGPPDAWDHATSALEVVLGESMGMVTRRIVCEATLAFDLEAFAAQRDAAQASLGRAIADARRLGAEL